METNTTGPQTYNELSKPTNSPLNLHIVSYPNIQRQLETRKPRINQYPFVPTQSNKQPSKSNIERYFMQFSNPIQWVHPLRYRRYSHKKISKPQTFSPSGLSYFGQSIKPLHVPVFPSQTVQPVHSIRCLQPTPGRAFEGKQLT